MNININSYSKNFTGEQRLFSTNKSNRFLERDQTIKCLVQLEVRIKNIVENFPMPCFEFKIYYPLFSMDNL